MDAPTTAASAEPVLLRYRRREVRRADVDFLRGVLEQHGERGPGAVARIVCDAWGWRQVNGGLALHACQDLVLRLGEAGLLELPEPRRRRARVRQRFGCKPLLPHDLIPLAWTEIGEDDVDLCELVVRPVQPEERLGWRLFMERYHYLGERPIVGEHLLYAAFFDGQLVALLGWAGCALRVPAREAFIGWSEEQKRARLHLVVNNIRFLVPRWVRVHNLASKVLALNLRRLSRDWQAAWGHPVVLAETFVDTARFRGTCYRAANWRYLGHTAGRRKRANAYLHDSTPKAVYVYELHRHARRVLCGEGAR